MTDPLLAQEILYAGPDLRKAARQSRIHQTPRDRLDGVRNATAILSDVIANRIRHRNKTRFELVIAIGKSPDTGDKLTAAYAGPGDNRAWCLSNVFAQYEVSDRTSAKEPDDVRRLLAAAKGNVDVFFREGLAGDVFSQAGLPFVRMPAWIKQRVRVLGDWPAQIDGMRRDTRQETARILRKYRYTCHLTRNADDHANFYDRLYRPYVARRFGATAHLVERDRFLKECRRGVVLQLTLQHTVLGAALLRPVGRTMAVVWSALDPDKEAVHLRGVTDALDYFSLLYAHLRGCRWLDLGPSRPDLCDGTLRYKAKRGAAIYPGLVPQSDIAWACRGQSDGERDFLLRHAFLIRTAGESRSGLRAVVFVDGRTDADAFAAKLSSILTPGVRDYRVVALSPPNCRLKEVVKETDANLTLVNAASYPDAMTAMKS
ncbi:MAG: hypothetical protein WD795_05475 [Woeseia sp.]